MSAIDKFRINGRISVALMDSADYHPSRIEDISDRDMVISMPMVEGIPLFLNNQGQFYGKIVIEGQLYRFTGTLVEKQLQPVPVWRVTLPQKIEKIQQRSFVRIQIMIPIIVELVKSGEDVPCEALHSFSRDLSAGGMQFTTPEYMGQSQQLHIALILPHQDALYTFAEVVRTERRKNKDEGYTNLVSVKFTDMDESRRCKIIQFIYRKQLERRQRDL